MEPFSAVPRDQLEADWLLQARLRWSPGEMAVPPALNRPATQSSVSQGSKTPPTHGQGIAWPAVLRATRDSGQALSDALEASATPDPEKLRPQWAAMADRLNGTPANAPDAESKSLYLQARALIRRLVFSRPEMRFEQLLFVKRAPSQFPHLSDQYYGWWSRPGGGVYILEDATSSQPRLRCLTGEFAPGNFLRPDVDHDAKKVVFAYAKFHPHVADLADKQTKTNLPEDSFYQIYELDLDDAAPRQITRGRYDDFDARYLPDGNILFLSTRKGTFLQSIEDNTAATLRADLPDSYVRCGGGATRPVPVYTMHAMTPDGGRMWPVSAFETFEYNPSVTPDGRILYCRWDYIDRFNGHFFSLWSTHQSGTNARLVYGNYTKRPQATMEPRAIPGSSKIIFTASAHHSITGGSLVLLDPGRGSEGEDPITRLTPEVPFPETEKNVDHYYANPWPLSEEVYLVSWGTARLPPHRRCNDPESNPVNAQGLYVYDRFGNLELLYRDPELSSMYPIPLTPRPRPQSGGRPMITENSGSDTEPVGAFLLQDVYEGLAPVERGAVARLRIVGVPPKPQPEMNKPVLGVSSEETGKYVLGSVPVEPDGSAFFEVPAGVPVFFQALDAHGRALQTMRSLTYVQPGETLACVGCHESRDATPPPRRIPLAALRKPSLLTPGPEGSWPLRFDRLVQPVLNRACLSCHQPGTDGAGFPLTPDHAWKSLLEYGNRDLHRLVFERDASLPGESPSKDSRLVAFLETDPIHRDLPLVPDDWRRLRIWMDTYGHLRGSFTDDQDRELEALRKRYDFLLKH